MFTVVAFAKPLGEEHACRKVPQRKHASGSARLTEGKRVGCSSLESHDPTIRRFFHELQAW